MNRYVIFLLFVGFLPALLLLAGCGAKKPSNTKAKLVDSLSQPIYPADHKLTAQERKSLSNKYLKQKGVPVLEHLPLVADYRTAKFRNEKEVAKKALVLSGLIQVAYEEKTSVEIIAYFKKYSLWSAVSPEEREYLQKQRRTKEDNIPVSWRVENLYVLLWALGSLDSLPFPANQCDFNIYDHLPDMESDPTEWVSNAKLRNTEDILNETDLIYRIHWATRQAGLDDKPMPANLNDDIVFERHFALNWLTMYAANWDDITTDT